MAITVQMVSEDVKNYRKINDAIVSVVKRIWVKKYLFAQIEIEINNK